MDTDRTDKVTVINSHKQRDTILKCKQVKITIVSLK